MYLEYLYYGMKNNPQGLTHNDTIRMCYEENGVPDGESMSDDQFSEMLSDPDYHASTPEGVLCFWDPTGSEGLTLQQAQAMDKNPRTEVTLGTEGETSTGG